MSMGGGGDVAQVAFDCPAAEGKGHGMLTVSDAVGGTPFTCKMLVHRKYPTDNLKSTNSPSETTGKDPFTYPFPRLVGPCGGDFCGVCLCAVICSLVIVTNLYVKVIYFVKLNLFIFYVTCFFFFSFF